jgi:hypothetical protein
MISHFLGWHVVDNGPRFHPSTGRFQAHRHGVRIGASTWDALRSMIIERATL